MIGRCKVCGARHTQFSCSTKQVGKNWVWTETCDNCGVEVDRFVMKVF